MGEVMRFRHAMAKHLGEKMTPEIAAEIEAYAFRYVDESIDPAHFAPAEYKGLTFRVESFRAIQDELHELHVAHWAETERAREGLPLNPRYEHVREAERRGELLQLTARNSVGTLVGNIRFYLFSDTHTQTPGAREDTFYLSPQVRNGFTAIRFWRYAERCLATIGYFEVWTDSKILYDADGAVIRNVGRLNEYLGYTHVANRFRKTLTKE
jgi:hypothetical protein